MYRNHILFMCVFSFCLSAQDLIVRNASDWKIDIYFQVKGTSGNQITLDSQTQEILSVLSPFSIKQGIDLIEKIAVKGHGIFKGWASPVVNVTDQVKRLLNDNIANLGQNNAVIVINAQAPSLTAPRGSWDITLRLEQDVYETSLEKLVVNPNAFFPRLAYVQWQRKQVDNPRYILNISAFMQPTKSELIHKKDDLLRRLKNITKNLPTDSQPTSFNKQLIELNIRPRISKAFDTLMKQYGYN